MDLPKGIKIVADEKVPKNEARLYQDGKLVGKITNIECPVVQTYRRGKQRTLNRPKPDQNVGITYNSKVTMAQLEKYWILSAVQQAGGSIQGAARLLGMARETVYRKVREYNREKK